MKISKLNQPHIKLQIAHWVAFGYSQRDIAAALNTSQPAIFRIVHKDDVQEMIAQEQERGFQMVKKALEEAEKSPVVQAAFQDFAMRELLKGILPRKEIQNVSELMKSMG